MGVLTSALVLGACSPAEQAAPTSGAIERFTSEIERGNAERKRLAVDSADARAGARAEEAKQRIAESERRRARENASEAGDGGR